MSKSFGKLRRDSEFNDDYENTKRFLVSKKRKNQFAEKRKIVDYEYGDEYLDNYGKKPRRK